MLTRPACFIQMQASFYPLASPTVALRAPSYSSSMPFVVHNDLLVDDDYSGCAVSPTIVSDPATSLSGRRETGGQFVLGQHYPTPVAAEIVVPFVLANPADVLLTVFDAHDRRVLSIRRKGLKAGEHRINLNLHGLGLGTGCLSYQLQVSNGYGTYQQRRGLALG